jgi:hypothetical protein
MKGAYLAMKKHRLGIFNSWRKQANQHRKPFKDTFAQDWFVDKINVED